MDKLEELQHLLAELKLPLLSEQIDSYLQDAAKKELDYTELMLTLLHAELCGRKEKRCELSIRLAKFPFVKTLTSFDFSYQPSINAKQIRHLAKSNWIASGENVIFLGPPGVGKTHLATALGIEAIRQGYRCTFVTAQMLITILAKAHAQNHLEAKLKTFCQPKLLLIDEIGYIPFDRQGANLFFQLISRRYEKGGAMIMTSNQAFINWGDVFGDRVIATAILDRVLHHSVTINIKGDSYRLKEKLKAGLLNHSQDESPS